MSLALWLLATLTIALHILAYAREDDAGSFMRFRQAISVILVVLGLLTACGTPTSSFGPVANKPHLESEEHSHDSAGGDQHAQQATGEGGALQPVLATSELVVGSNRVALALLENNVPIPDAAQTQVKVRFYKLEGNQGTMVGEEEARYYGEGLGPRGTFIVHPNFDRPGQWGLELVSQRPGKPATTQRLSVEVTDKGSAPSIGAPAPKSKTPTARETKDLKTITSASTPDPRLYQLSVDQAVTNGKPSLILFATPGFCQTQVCGPGVEVLQKLVDKFGDRANAVHIEVYQYPFDPLKPVAAMQEWGLQSEPWLFLVDRQGRIAGRYEGGITYEELEPAVAALVQ